jgi:hypothetical protein
MNKILLLGCLCGMLAACQNNPDPTSIPDEPALVSDTLQYQLVEVTRQLGDCEEGNDFTCTRASVAYLRVTGGVAPQVQNRINAQIEYLLHGDTSSIEAVLEAFVAEYIDLIASEPDLRDFEAGWQWETTQSVLFNHPTVLTIKDFTLLFTGGAHGNYATEYLNFDLRTGERIPASAFFKPEQFDALNQLGEQYFRRHRDIPNGQRIQDMMEYWFPNDRFYLSQNVGFTSKGLVFTYAPYEIASYADGEISLLIPYEELEFIALPGSALAAVVASRKGLSEAR